MMGRCFLDWVQEMSGLGINTRSFVAHDDVRRRIRSQWVSKLNAPNDTSASRESGFRLRLESHLRDFRSGRPWRSLQVNQELRDRHQENRVSLAELDPESLRLYVDLISGMDYEQQARLAATVFSMNRHLMELKQAGDALG